MKYTGIVRRLDALGRIVIPREYRKTHKIKEGDPLEIIAMDNGEIIVRKVDLSAELIAYGTSIIERLSQATKENIMLSNGEKFLLGNGNIKDSLTDTILPSKVQNLIEARKDIKCNASEISLEGKYVCIKPIYKEDCFGALYLFSGKEISESDETVLETCAKILADLMQKY